MTDSQTPKEENQRPTHKLVQDYSYYSYDGNGNRYRKNKTIDIAFGWLKTSQKGESFIDWGVSFQPVVPDADGRIKRLVFELKYNN